MCRKVWRTKNIRKYHKLVMELLTSWKQQLDATTPAQRKALDAKRQKYFRVDRWWWDRYKRDKIYKMLDAIDRLIQPKLHEYPKALYVKLLTTASSLLGHPGLSLPRETALLSRLSRWLKRKPHPPTVQYIVKKASASMLARKECPWWYLVFMGTFDVKGLQRVSQQISPSWCKAKKVFNELRYHTDTQVNQKLKHWAKTYPRIAKLHNFGRSFEGRPLLALQVGYRYKKYRAQQNSILLVGNQHADEHVGTEVLMDFTRRLFKRYKKRERKVRTWMKTRQLWIIPVLNPDGKVFDLLGGIIKWWRYNRKVHTDGQIGVDLNRNFGYKWKRWSFYRGGRITLPGTRPFSEPETNALRRLAKKLPRLKAILDVHQYGAVVLLPYAFSRTALPAPYQRQYVQLSRYLAATNGYKYYPAHRLYPHQGTLGDWGFGEFKALSLVLELGYKQYIGPARMNRVIRKNRLLLDRFIELGKAPYEFAQKMNKGTLTPPTKAGN
tara:strand:+ start:5697 stop:7181 length:1485 start_codon:yes stop_codon:yes gene_type:complete